MIARGDGTPLYNLAVAVDDAEMGITDVVRGDDHLSNTPKQLLVLGALGAPPPRYAHLPLLHGPDGRKLSKRDGAASVQELRDLGYLPAAVRNYLALLGWGTEDDTTILDHGGAGRAVLDRAGGPLGGDLRRAQAALDERPLHARAATRGLRAAARRPPAAASAGGRERLRRRAARAAPRRPARSCADKAQTLAEVWPLVRFLFVEPEPDPAAWEKVMTGDAGLGAGRGARGPARASTASTPPRSRRRSGRRWSARAEAEGRLPADPRRDHGDHGLARDLRLARGARPRAPRWSGSSTRWPSWGAERRSAVRVRQAPTARSRAAPADPGGTG